MIPVLQAFGSRTNTSLLQVFSLSPFLLSDAPSDVPSDAPSDIPSSAPSCMKYTKSAKSSKSKKIQYEESPSNDDVPSAWLKATLPTPAVLPDGLLKMESNEDGSTFFAKWDNSH